MQAVRAELTTAAGRGIETLGASWQPAEHNLPAGDDRRWHVRSQANRAADAGAGSCAEAGRDDELRLFQTHSPPSDPDAAYFSHGGAPIIGDIRVRTLHAVGMRTAVRLAVELQSGEKKGTRGCWITAPRATRRR